MITLRELARRDRAVAAITTDECHFIAQMLNWCGGIAQHWPLKYFMPPELRKKDLSMRMLAAILGRTQEERKTLQAEIQKAMEDDKC